ncbi:MAG: hypothetical protein QOE41_1403 [Mycobacterium sp.]|jgi:hypothetical protein|nr:hypothetical protein [Mycobacterium sp.]MDT5132092.1 hypothetical protein [Mycobacterium sp.]
MSLVPNPAQTDGGTIFDTKHRLRPREGGVVE